MDWHLNGQGQTAYRVCQCTAVLTVVLRISLRGIQPSATAFASLALVVAALLLLGSIVRAIGRYTAGAIALLLISLSPDLVLYSHGQALSFFCLSTLVWLLVTRDWMRANNQVRLPLALAACLTLGSRSSFSFLTLSPAVTFASLLQCCVPPDSMHPYRTLGRSLRLNPAGGFRSFLIIAVVPWLLAFPLWRNISAQAQSATASALTNAVGYADATGRSFIHCLGMPAGLTTEFASYTTLVLIGSAITLWWLFVAMMSGNGVAFSLTTIPIAYLISESLDLHSAATFARPVHPILLANLIAFMGLWWRGRANKRVLDSTPD